MMPRVSVARNDAFHLPWEGRGLFGQGLTDRELEILAEVARGRNNNEVGATLAISEQTVKNHMSRILSKLGCPDRTAAVVLAIHRGLLELEGVTPDRDWAAEHIAGIIRGRCTAIETQLAAITSETANLRERVSALRATAVESAK